jgi:hypothetical protein
MGVSCGIIFSVDRVTLHITRWYNYSCMITGVHVAKWFSLRCMCKIAIRGVLKSDDAGKERCNSEDPGISSVPISREGVCFD